MNKGKKSKTEESKNHIADDEQKEEIISEEAIEKSEIEKADEKILDLEKHVKEMEDKFLRKVAEFENLLAGKLARHFQPRVWFGPSLASARLDSPGPVPDPDLSDELKQSLSLRIRSAA